MLSTNLNTVQATGKDLMVRNARSPSVIYFHKIFHLQNNERLENINWPAAVLLYIANRTKIY